jgi:hypothetical protein
LHLGPADPFTVIAGAWPRPRADPPRCRSASAARYVRAVGQMAKVLRYGENSARRQGPGKFSAGDIGKAWPCLWLIAAATRITWRPESGRQISKNEIFKVIGKLYSVRGNLGHLAGVGYEYRSPEPVHSPTSQARRKAASVPNLKSLWGSPHGRKYRGEAILRGYAGLR